jgi:Cu(I)/Ag(I) efflux system membrane protein CusA/SilA
MIDRVINWSIEHRWWVVTITLVLALLGFYAARQTPVDAIPDLSENQVIVYTPWPGHAPPEVEARVTSVLSAQLQGIEGVLTVRGSSELNFSAINVVFGDDVGVAEARRRVESRLSQVRGLPPGIRAELAPEAPATGQIFWYVLVAPELDLARLRTLQDAVVRPQLASVSGVAEVASVGGFLPEYKIQVDPVQLADRKLTVDQLFRAIEALEVFGGTQVVSGEGSEIVVQAVPRLQSSDSPDDRQELLEKLRATVLRDNTGTAVTLGDVARVSIGPLPRRGVFEMDGVETVGGVVMMRYGANPLEVTDRLERRLEEIEAGLPHGVTILTVYDRVRLIHSALGTVSTTMLEAMITASLCVVVVLLHFRTSLVISLTLPLTVLGSFLMLWCLRSIGWWEARTNIMSLAGLVISIGVLVDSSVVIAENVVHALRERFGDQPVHGDVRGLVARACRGVGRPVFFSVLIMLLSFFPVLALSGLEGKMFRPLALTKSFALVAAAVLAITVVPALCTFFVRGRMRREEDSWLVRTTLEAYRPLLTYLLDRPAALAVVMGVTFILGFAPLGNAWLAKGVLAIALLSAGLLTKSWGTRVVAGSILLLVALLVQPIRPLSWERIPPLDEGTAMDMPITLPRISVSQAADDLKMRDMVLCRFPEVDMIMGKAGRADTATDPAPIDMIETMIMYRPHEFWPRRKLPLGAARQQTEAALEMLVRRDIIPADSGSPDFVQQVVDAVQPRFDAQLREYCYQRNKSHQRDVSQALRTHLAKKLVERLNHAGLLLRPATTGDLAELAKPGHEHYSGAHTPTWRDLRRSLRTSAARARELKLITDDADVLSQPPSFAAKLLNAGRMLLGEQRETILSLLVADLQAEHDRLWRRHVAQLNEELPERAAGVYTRLAFEEILARIPSQNTEVQAHIDDVLALKLAKPATSNAAAHHHEAVVPQVRKSYLLDEVHRELSQSFANSLMLQANDRRELGGFGGEMDLALQMPGWTNVWTRPIQNRVDMLSTGVNTDIGICVQGRNLEEVVAASERVAEVVNNVPGASQVVADPIRGKPYLKVRVDDAELARREIPLSDLNATLEMALGGRIVAQVGEGRQQVDVRLMIAAESGRDPQHLRELPIVRSSPTASRTTLGEVADLKLEDGPTSIKSENGLLRNYVRLNVRGRDPQQFINDARQIIAQRVELPAGVFLTWTGQFEHQQRSQQSLALLMPLVLVLIVGVLVWTYRDVADALLVMLALPGAMAGGLFMQWLCGTNLSVTVLVGYIACFGMAASTGMIMLVYLRDAVERAGGLEQMTLADLRTAVLSGAVQRLRPKLLTELTTVIGLAPMLWATGIGSEVIRPMAAPVLGGILVADEVIDLFLPVAFYWVRRWRWQRLRRERATALAETSEPAMV